MAVYGKRDCRLACTKNYTRPVKSFFKRICFIQLRTAVAAIKTVNTRLIIDYIFSTREGL